MKDIAFSMLVHWRLVRQLEERVPDFRANFHAIQQSVSPALMYPDGSFEYELHPETQELWLACMALRSAGMSVSFLGYIPSLPWFPGLPKPRKFKLISSVDHEKRVDPSGCLMFGPRHEDAAVSCDLSALHVNVQCHRRIRREDMALLTGAFQDWHASVSGTRLFGEGPVDHLSQELEFQGRRVQFRLDASRTGQRTLNWLILTLLNATYDAVRLSAIIFNDVENLASYGLEPSDEKIVCLPLGKHPLQANQPSEGNEPESRVPTGLVPFPGQRSEHFTIWQTPRFEWESMRLAVYFEDWPNREQQRDFRTLMGAWSTVAQAGGFGGKGAPVVGEALFFKKQRAGRLDANLGDVDPDVAIPVLIRLLENYATGTLGIEAVVFGLDPNDTVAI